MRWPNATEYSDERLDAIFPKERYDIESRRLKTLYRIATRLNDGMRIDPDDRRDMAQLMQAILRATEEEGGLE